MKNVAMGSLLFLSALTLSEAACIRNSSELEAIFQHPVSIGASVSSGAHARPAVLVFRDTILNGDSTNAPVILAENGVTSPSQIVKLTDMLNEKRNEFSGVFALDLFFWDTMNACRDIQESIVENFFKKAVPADVPIIIGTVPVLHPFKQNVKCTKNLNDLIFSLCSDRPRCYVIDLYRRYQELKEESAKGGVKITFKGETKLVSMKELFPDDLHPTEEALTRIASDWVRTQLSSPKDSAKSAFLKRLKKLFHVGRSESCN